MGGRDELSLPSRRVRCDDVLFGLTVSMCADKVAISRANSSVWFMMYILYTCIAIIASVFFKEFQVFPAANCGTDRSARLPSPVDPPTSPIYEQSRESCPTAFVIDQIDRRIPAALDAFPVLPPYRHPSRIGQLNSQNR